MGEEVLWIGSGCVFVCVLLHKERRGSPLPPSVYQKECERDTANTLLILKHMSRRGSEFVEGGQRLFRNWASLQISALYHEANGSSLTIV